MALNFPTLKVMHLMYVKWDSERRGVCGREMEKDGKRAHIFFLLWCLLLLSTFACGQVCSCHGSPRNKEETDRRGEFLLSEGCDESSSLYCHWTQRSLCKQETTKEGGREDAEDNKQRPKRRGRERSVRQDVREREGDRERRGELSSQRVWLIPTVLDIALGWEACS